MDVIARDLAEFRLSSSQVRLLGTIDEFKGSWAALGQMAPDRLGSLRKVATIESVGSSTRIEGARLTDAEVDALLSGLRTESFRSRDEQEVAGYADLMEMILASWPEINLTEGHVLQLHGVLLRHSSKDQRHRGKYKTLANHVEAFDADGKSLGEVFPTASPFSTPGRMAELVEATRTALDEDKLHPLLVIGVFVLRFLAIHPFQDGNGRLSRVLTTLLLLRAGYLHVPYSSLERIVEDNRDRYYQSLRRSQSSLDTDQSDPGPWLSFFLDILARQTEALAAIIARERLLDPVPALSQAILDLVRERGRAAVRDIVAVTRANRNTVKSHLARLVERGSLVQNGRGKGTWYSLRRPADAPG